MSINYRSILQAQGLRDTLPRRTILRLLESSKKALSIEDIHAGLREFDESVGIVTVYRVVDALKKAGLIHKHAENTFSFCNLPEDAGHHLILHCTSCGSVQETHDEGLCKRENVLAKKFDFRPHHHVHELLGTCSSCS